MTLAIFLASLNAAVIVPPFIIALYRLRQLASAGLLLGLFCIFNFFSEAVQNFIIWYGKDLFGTNNNLWLIHLSGFVSYVIFSLVYYKVFSRKRLKDAVLWTLPLVVAVSLADAFYLNDLTQFNTFAGPLQRSLLIVFSLLYLDKVFRELKVKRLDQDPVFLFAAGSLIYCSGSILITAVYNLLLASSREVALAIYCIDAILMIFFNSIVGLAVWYAGREEPTPVRNNLGAQ